ncbi:glycosyl transferase [Paenibacillus sp. MY03]|uniref:glycosyltransferase n=1 Tax=Paenibacillus sp. MY03 TaxID=302980 RepID=UPI000B3C49DB|nr:glycosyltransferase [Paenibacillus sp. MY03]OUS78068.1 glycosyl transferase [Paenibacillus sp. MY03]
MKKKLLFVIPSLAAGGGERSLVNLLSQIDYSKFDVDVFLFHQVGMFLEHLPEQVSLLPHPINYRRFILPLSQSLAAFLSRGQFRLAYRRLRYAMVHRTPLSVGEREQKAWKHMAETLQGFTGVYDTAIGFLEKTSIYMCVDHIRANSKIGWIHNDYLKLETNAAFDQRYFRRLNHIVTVSDECAATLKSVFSEQSNKVSIIHNIVSPNIICRLAQHVQQDLFERRDQETVILTIGRLHSQKGLELAVEACRILLDRGLSIQWNVIGEGEERESLDRLIDRYRLGQSFRLLGLRSNPYPYLHQADIYVQTSRFEGKSIAIDEAKILNKPIVVTNFSTAKDQIRHDVDGLIVGMNAESIADGIMRLIENKELRNRLSQALSGMDLGTEDEIKKLYQLLA